MASLQPTNGILLKEYKGVNWKQVDFLIMQEQRFASNSVKFLKDDDNVFG